MRKLVLLAVVAVASAAATETVQYEERQIERPIPGCPADRECYVRLRWVEVISAPADVQKRINATILDVVTAAAGVSPEKYASDFIRGYQQDVDAGIQPHGWYLSSECSVLRDSEPVFSLECQMESYTGGAHPELATHYLMFNTATGARLFLESILAEGAMPQFMRVAERHFREVRNLSATDLKEAGFFLPDGQFRVPAVGIDEMSLFSTMTRTKLGIGVV